jgi:stearoyl-CoA desaturase (delta-9 desaturase)
MAKYVKTLKTTMSEEIAKLHGPKVDVKTFRRWLHFDKSALKAPEQETLDQALKSSKVLDTIYSMRHDLAAIWARSTATQEQLVKQLEDWCQRAEASGIDALQQFSRRLRCYA